MARRRPHRDRIRAKPHPGTLATFTRRVSCHVCGTPHVYRLRLDAVRPHGGDAAQHYDPRGRLAGHWFRAIQRLERTRAKAARRQGFAAEPLDPIPPLTIAELRALAKRHRRKAG